ncbi:MAG TPA: hypothetical protein VIL49_07460, partial [Capillimicrobium sp.]
MHRFATHRLLPIAAALAATAALPAAAQATDFCVHEGAHTCPAGSADMNSDLQAALTAAAGNADTSDHVWIAQGDYYGPFAQGFNDADHVTITGIGPGTKTLTAPAAANTQVLQVNGENVEVSQLRVRIPGAAANATGVRLEGRAIGLEVEAGAGATGNVTGVFLKPGADLRASTVDLGVD